MKRIIFFSMLATCAVSHSSPICSMLGAGETELIGEEGIVPVEYLESTGTQWIDTGITPDINGISSLQFIPTVTSPCPWGCANFTEVINYGRYFDMRGTVSTAYRVAGRFYDICIDGIAKKYYVNGAEQSCPNTWFSVHATGSCWLFGRSDTGVLGSLKIYGAQFYHGAEQVRDLIPVRFSNGEYWEGAMLDRVTGELFFNQGAGNFIVGPDKEVE